MTYRELLRTIPRRRLACTLSSVILAAVWATSVAGQAGTARPRILLTNDDGYEAAGITALRAALVAHGFDVTLVAPSTNQSSSSARMSSGVLRYAEAADGVWHIDGSPADAVLFGLRVVMADAPPDLVLSGTNAGQNIGTSTSTSGTVGAAVTAARRGFPAIAISAQIGGRGSANVFEGAADFAVRLVDQLSTNRGVDGALLPAGTVLNVNYPALPADEIRGVRYAPVSHVASLERGFTMLDTPGEIRIGLRRVPRDEVPDDTDVAALEDGYVTVNLIQADADAGADALRSVERRLTLTRE